MSLAPASPPASPGQSIVVKPTKNVVLAIRRRIIAQGCGSALDSLPSYETMKWVAMPESVAHPPTGLVIGTDHDGNDVVAFLSALERSREQMTYRSQRKILSFVDAAKSALRQPFQGLASKRLEYLIKWYFLTKGLLGSEPRNDYSEFCGILEAALRSNSRPHSRALRKSTIVEDTSQSEQPGNQYELRSSGIGTPGARQETSTSTPRPVPLPTPSEEPPSTSRKGQDKSVLAGLEQYLADKGVAGLKRHLLEIHELQFGFHEPSWAGKKKLFVGHTSEGHYEIFAYLRRQKDQFQTRYFHTTGSSHEIADSTEWVTKQNLLHPFIKTIPEDTSQVGGVDTNRLNVLVKWYFLSSGHAPNLFIEPLNVKNMLEFVDKRMSAIELKAMDTFTGTFSAPAVPTGRRSSTPPLEVITGRASTDELYDPPEASNSSQTQVAPQASPPDMPNDQPQASNSLSGSKRRREDDELDDPQYAELQETTRKEHKLRNVIKADEQELREKDRWENLQLFKLKQERELFEKEQEEARRAFDEREASELQTIKTKYEREKRAIVERKERNVAERLRLSQSILEYYRIEN